MLKWILKFMIRDNIEPQTSKDSFTLFTSLFIIHRSSTWCSALRLWLILSHSITRLPACLNIMIILYFWLLLRYFGIPVLVFASNSNHFLSAVGLVYIGAVVQLSSIVNHLLREIIVHISRFLRETISWIEGIAVDIIILILDVVLSWGQLLVLSGWTELIVLWIGVS